MDIPYVNEAQKRGRWTNTEIHGRLPRRELSFSVVFFTIKIVDAPNTSHDIVSRSHQLHNANGCLLDKLQLYAYLLKYNKQNAVIPRVCPAQRMLRYMLFMTCRPFITSLHFYYFKLRISYFLNHVNQ